MSHPTPDRSSAWNVELVDLSNIPFAPLSFHLPALVKAAAESTPIVLPFANGLEGSFTLKAMTQGTTNHLFKATGMTSTGQEFVRMIKIYGDGTNITIDRRKELAVHKLLSDRSLSSDLVLRFGNGHIYTFVSGDVCSTQEIHNPESYHATAKEMARWHATLPLAFLELPLTALTVQPGIWATMQRWIEAIPDSAATWSIKKSDLQHEFDFLFNNLMCGGGSGAAEPMVFGHGDLLCGNIILNRAPTPLMIRRTVYDDLELGCKARFIDYEHATYVPRAFELANHFSEWAGFECDYTKLPSIGQRHAFIADYLLEYTLVLKRNAHPEIPDESDPFYRPARPDLMNVERLMREVDSYRGFPGFYWGICAIIQAETATGAIDFDYKAYAIKRLSEYNAWKTSVMGFVPEGWWAPGREAWWHRY